jgi:hypothetical protein
MAGVIAGATLPAATPAPATLPPPATFQDDPGTRFITVEWHEGGKVKFALRTVGAPGQYGHWAGDGDQTDKGIVFAQTVEEGDRGAFYIATGGQGRLVVKLKPGQAGVQDGGLVGTYHHITDEKLASILKKDSELAEKKVDEAVKAASRKLAAEDKPALAEWKKRWPDLRARLTVNAGKPTPKPGAAAPPQPPPTPPAVGQPATTTPSAKDQIAYYMALAETSGSAAAFVAQPLPPGVKPGWEGVYDDGFGGSLDVQQLKSGRVKFIINTSRLGGSATGTMEESVPPETVKDNPTGSEGTADYTDKNPEVKDPTQQTRLHFHRIGHYIIVESQYAERYANRGWFDGVYAKRPTPPPAD